MSRDDDGDRPAYGPDSFVHLDVRSAYARLSSPNTPLEYATDAGASVPTERPHTGRRTAPTSVHNSGRSTSLYPNHSRAGCVLGATSRGGRCRAVRGGAMTTSA